MPIKIRRGSNNTSGNDKELNAEVQRCHVHPRVGVVFEMGNSLNIEKEVVQRRPVHPRVGVVFEMGNSLNIEKEVVQRRPVHPRVGVVCDLRLFLLPAVSPAVPRTWPRDTPSANQAPGKSE